MNPKIFIYVFLTTSILDVAFKYTENRLSAFSFELIGIVSLICFYINATKKINNLYLAVLIISCIFPYLFINNTATIFGIELLYIATFLIAINKILYSIISLKEIKKINQKNITSYIIILGIYILPILIVVPFISSFLKGFLLPTIIVSIIDALMCYFAFLRFFSNPLQKNLFYLIALTLFVIVDFLFVYHKFISSSLIIAMAFSTLVYISRFLICIAMVQDKKKPFKNKLKDFKYNF